jgi:hypothetical protein
MAIVPQFSADFAEAMLASYERSLGAPLVDGAATLSAALGWLYADAPFCVLAHDASDDPRFVFANLTAQRCFEYGWEELVGMPSRLSAGAPDRDERTRLLEGVRRDGFVRHYRGLRIAKSGRQFWIEDVTVWNVTDARGVRRGQAATYQRTTPAG